MKTTLDDIKKIIEEVGPRRHRKKQTADEDALDVALAFPDEPEKPEEPIQGIDKEAWDKSGDEWADPESASPWYGLDPDAVERTVVRARGGIDSLEDAPRKVDVKMPTRDVEDTSSWSKKRPSSLPMNVKAPAKDAAAKSRREQYLKDKTAAEAAAEAAAARPKAPKLKAATRPQKKPTSSTSLPSDSQEFLQSAELPAVKRKLKKAPKLKVAKPYKIDEGGIDYKTYQKYRKEAPARAAKAKINKTLEAGGLNTLGTAGKKTTEYAKDAAAFLADPQDIGTFTANAQRSTAASEVDPGAGPDATDMRARLKKRREQAAAQPAKEAAAKQAVKDKKVTDQADKKSFRNTVRTHRKNQRQQKKHEKKYGKPQVGTAAHPQSRSVAPKNENLEVLKTIILEELHTMFEEDRPQLKKPEAKLKYEPVFDDEGTDFKVSLDQPGISDEENEAFHQKYFPRDSGSNLKQMPGAAHPKSPGRRGTPAADSGERISPGISVEDDIADMEYRKSVKASQIAKSRARRLGLSLGDTDLEAAAYGAEPATNYADMVGIPKHKQSGWVSPQVKRMQKGWSEKPQFIEDPGPYAREKAAAAKAEEERKAKRLKAPKADSSVPRERAKKRRGDYIDSLLQKESIMKILGEEILSEVEKPTSFRDRLRANIDKNLAKAREGKAERAAEEEFFGEPLEPTGETLVGPSGTQSMSAVETAAVNLLDGAEEEELLKLGLRSDKATNIVYRALFVEKDPIAIAVYNRFKKSGKNIFGNEKEFLRNYYEGPEAHQHGQEQFQQGLETRASRESGDPGSGKVIPGREMGVAAKAELDRMLRNMKVSKEKRSAPTVFMNKSELKEAIFKELKEAAATLQPGAKSQIDQLSAQEAGIKRADNMSTVDQDPETASANAASGWSQIQQKDPEQYVARKEDSKKKRVTEDAVSDKTDYLIDKEDKDPKQAYAIAKSMEKRGELEENQMLRQEDILKILKEEIMASLLSEKTYTYKDPKTGVTTISDQPPPTAAADIPDPEQRAPAGLKYTSPQPSIADDKASEKAAAASRASGYEARMAQQEQDRLAQLEREQERSMAKSSELRQDVRDLIDSPTTDWTDPAVHTLVAAAGGAGIPKSPGPGGFFGGGAGATSASEADEALRAAHELFGDKPPKPPKAPSGRVGKWLRGLAPQKGTKGGWFNPKSGTWAPWKRAGARRAVGGAFGTPGMVATGTYAGAKHLQQDAPFAADLPVDQAGRQKPYGLSDIDWPWEDRVAAGEGEKYGASEGGILQRGGPFAAAHAQKDAKGEFILDPKTGERMPDYKAGQLRARDETSLEDYEPPTPDWATEPEHDLERDGPKDAGDRARDKLRDDENRVVNWQEGLGEDMTVEELRDFAAWGNQILDSESGIGVDSRENADRRADLKKAVEEAGAYAEAGGWRNWRDEQNLQESLQMDRWKILSGVKK